MPFQIVCFFRLLKIKDEELENMNTSDLNINILLLGPKTKRQHLNKIQDAAATTPADLTWNHLGMFSVKTCQNKTSGQLYYINLPLALQSFFLHETTACYGHKRSVDFNMNSNRQWMIPHVPQTACPNTTQMSVSHSIKSFVYNTEPMKNATLFCHFSFSHKLQQGNRIGGNWED